MAAGTAWPRGPNGLRLLPDRPLRGGVLAGEDWVQIPVASRIAGDHGPALPRRRGPDLAGLAAFTLDSQGRVASWPVSAERLFGHAAPAVTGRHVCDVLMTGPGQRELAGDALAEVSAGRVWTATMSMAFAGGSGPVAIRWEPLGGPGAGVLVIGQHVSPAVSPGWLREAADRIGTTLDLPRTAREVADVAVPTFSDVIAIFVFERLLAADEPVAPQAGHGAVMRRLVTRLAGQPAAVTDSLLRPGEVIVFGDDSPSFRAMHTRSPVLFDRLDDESAERISRRPGGHELASSWASFLSVPLVARGVVLGCATFGRAPQSPDFGPDDVAAAGELASRAAVCIDNARLYHRERRTAFALQRGLLPGEPRVPPAMEVAHRYLPVGASMVGGDWHDWPTRRSTWPSGKAGTGSSWPTRPPPTPRTAWPRSAYGFRADAHQDPELAGVGGHVGGGVGPPLRDVGTSPGWISSRPVNSRRTCSSVRGCTTRSGGGQRVVEVAEEAGQPRV